MQFCTFKPYLFSLPLFANIHQQINGKLSRHGFFYLFFNFIVVLKSCQIPRHRRHQII
jgi:hypothetical protein